MRISSLLANAGMVLSNAQASQLIAAAAYDHENLVNKDFGSNKQAKVMSDSFENFFSSSAMQKLAQLGGEKLLGKKIGSDFAAYGASFLYMLFHKAMIADRNYEYIHNASSYVPKILPKFYKVTILPLVKFIKEKIYGIHEDKIEYPKLLLSTAAVFGSSFLDKSVAYPGTREIREATTLKDRLSKTIRSKFLYILSYFSSQGLVATMYDKSKISQGPRAIIQQLKSGFQKAIKVKGLSTYAVALADALTDLLNGNNVSTKIPSPILAAILRYTFVQGAANIVPPSGQTQAGLAKLEKIQEAENLRNKPNQNRSEESTSAKTTTINNIYVLNDPNTLKNITNLHKT